MPHPPPSSFVPPSPSLAARRRPSISSPMNWLTRHQPQASVSSIKTASISEPKMLLSENLMSPRAGMLGSGATVVSTPEEALRDTRRLGADLESTGSRDEATEPQDEHGQEIEYSPAYAAYADGSSSEDEELLSPVDSPALPPLPTDDKEAAQIIEPRTPQPFTFPPRTDRIAPPAPPPTSSLRPNRESVDSIPALPLPVVPAVVAQPFSAILVSEPPAPTADRTKVIVSLETCTATYRTTVATLSSRPSKLAQYIHAQFGTRQRFDSNASSVYSTASAEDLSIYQRHLISQGHISQRPASIDIFLDRPSEPYVHILSYLRTPEPTEGPEVLPPRAAQAGLDALLELRDEAAFLGLDNLQRLCVEEIKRRRRPRPRTPRTHSSERSVITHHSQASVNSLHTLLEKTEPPQPTPGSQHVRSLSRDSGVDEMSQQAPPTPESWSGRRVRSQTRKYNSLRPPPAGWI